MKDFSEIIDLVESVECRMQDAYDTGYERGYNDCKEKHDAEISEQIDEVKEDGYKQGLNDGWKYAGKIANYTSDEFENIFGYSYHDQFFKNCSPAEAIITINNYEMKLKKQDENFELGDEVECRNLKSKCVVINNVNEKTVLIMCLDELRMLSVATNQITKTGRHFIQFEKVIEMLKDL